MEKGRLSKIRRFVKKSKMDKVYYGERLEKADSIEENRFKASDI